MLPFTVKAADTTYTGPFSGTINSGDTAILATGASINWGITNNGELRFAQSGNLTAGWSIGGSGKINQAGTGTTFLSPGLFQAYTFTGGVEVNSGTLVVSGDLARNANNAITINGGTLSFNKQDVLGNWSQEIINPVTINAGGILQNGATVYNTLGALTLNGGTLRSTALESPSGTAFGLKGTVSVTGETASTIAGAGIALGEYNVTNATFNVDNGSRLNVTGNLVNSDGTTWGVDRASSLTKTGQGTMALSGNNSYTGGTILEQGTLALESANALGSTGLISFAGGTLQFSANNTTDYSSRFNNAGATQYYNFDTNGQAITLAGNMFNANGTLTKSGAGTLTLTGNNSYTGTTTVSSGGLVVNGNLSSSNTTVASGAFIGGNGTVGALTVASGGSIAPGNSPGILETGNLNLQGEIEMEIAGTSAGTQYDQIDVTGTVTLGATSMLSVTLLNSFAPVNDDLIFILSNDGSDAISGTFSGLAHLSTFFVGDTEWQISYLANYSGSSTGTFLGGNDIALMAIPEPSAALLGALGALMLLRRRRI